MPRNLSFSANFAMKQETVRLRLLADILFVGTTMNVCAGVDVVQVGSTTYAPIGALGGAEAVRENVDSFRQTVKLWLSLIDDTSRNAALNEELFNRTVRLYRVILNDDGTIVSTPSLVYRGVFSDVRIKEKDSERGDVIEVLLTNRLQRNPPGAYYTREALQQSFSGDTFFDYLPQIATAKPALWGQQAVYFGGAPEPNVRDIPRVRGFPRP